MPEKPLTDQEHQFLKQTLREYLPMLCELGIQPHTMLTGRDQFGRLSVGLQWGVTPATEPAEPSSIGATHAVSRLPDDSAASP